MLTHDLNQRFTSSFTTQGFKILRHTEALLEIQKHQRFRPIQIQLAPTEVCESGCPFCSVRNRAVREYISFHDIERGLSDFAALGARALEITGGGNPLLYRDRKTGDDINSIISIAANLGLEVGIVTNSSALHRVKPSMFDSIKWIRISLIGIDEGKRARDYDFCGYPDVQVGMSYIYYSKPKTGVRTRRSYAVDMSDTAREIVELYDLHPEVKFIRIAADASLGSTAESDMLSDSGFLSIATSRDRIFVQERGAFGNSVFDEGCYVGAIRPFIGTSPDRNGKALVYICSCHTHFCGNRYDKRFALCELSQVRQTWDEMARRFSRDGHPYEVMDNGGCGWSTTCRTCYYRGNNELLHAVAHTIEDANFV